MGMESAKPTILDTTVDTEVDLPELKRRAAKGGLTLLIRQLAIQLLGLFAGVALARILSPAVFGLFAIINMVISFFTLFGDLGLGAALIQQKEEISDEQLHTLFVIQQIFVTACVMLIWLVAALLPYWYADSLPEIVWLIRATSLGWLFTSLRAVPAVRLERQLRFLTLSLIEFSEQFIYYTIAVLLAWYGYGIWALIIGVLARGLAGTILIYLLTGWQPQWQVNWKDARRLLHFGLSVQMVHLVLYINSAMLPLLVGSWWGSQAVGLALWAYGNAHRPMQLMEHLWRVFFPSISRVQSDKQLLNRALQRLLYLVSICIFAYLALWLGLAEAIVKVIYTEKWLPALPALYIFLFAMIFSVSASLIDVCSISMGKPQIVRNLHLWRGAIGWLLALPATFYGGIIGFAAATLVMFMLLFVLELFYVLRKYYQVSWLTAVRLPLFAAFCSTIVGYLLSSGWSSSPTMLILSAIAIGITYLTPFLIWDRGLLYQFNPWQLWKWVRSSNT